MDILEAQNRRVMWASRWKRWLATLRRKIKPLNPIDRVHLDQFSRPHYAYGVYLACMQARMLNQSATTAIEFGVAGGNGLIALEDCAAQIGDALNVKVHVLGFDTGEGMPPSTDPKDMVYWYRPTAYKMDVAKLRNKLRHSRLFLGPIQETVAEATRDLAGPIGFCSFDMDYYSATAAALRIFDAVPTSRQPRVIVYADDIFGYHDLNVVCEDVGEEQAFREFNDAHCNSKIRPIRGLRYKRPIPAMWNEKMFALHDFSHPDYNTCMNPNSPTALAELSRLL